MNTNIELKNKTQNEKNIENSEVVFEKNLKKVTKTVKFKINLNYVSVSGSSTLVASPTVDMHWIADITYDDNLISSSSCSSEPPSYENEDVMHIIN